MSENGTLPTEDSKTAIRVVNGELSYPTSESGGYGEIELPALPGSPNAVERCLVRDFGAHVVGKIESAMQRNPYLKSGPTQSPSQVLRHYVGAARGYGLMDSAAIGRMSSLAAEFEKEPEQGEFFKRCVMPYLLGLTSERRK